MHPIVSLYGIYLIGLSALALPQTPDSSKSSPQQQQKLIDDAATALASLQAQTSTTIAALSALSKSDTVRGNARLAAQNIDLLAILEGVPQLARDERAILVQSNTPVPTPTAPPSQSSAPVGEQCNLLQSQSNLYQGLKLGARTIAAAPDSGSSQFFFLSKLLQLQSGCQKSSSEFCKSIENLMVKLQGVGKSLAQAAAISAQVAGDGHNAQRLQDRANLIVSSIEDLQDSIEKIQTSLQCKQ